MIVDVSFNESTGDIVMEDKYGMDAFRQSLILQLITTSESVLTQLSIGSNMWTIGKNTSDIKSRLEKIISDAWSDSISEGEVKSFEILYVEFDYSKSMLKFDIEIDTPSGTLNIKNV